VELLVDVAGLSHFYGERQALREVSFSVGKGEIFALLGPNGGGKSTLFQVLSTAQPPMQGRVRVLGHDLAGEISEVRRRLGVVFQSPSLDKKLRVAENLRHQGRLYGMRGPELEARIRAMLERFGLADRAHESVEKLSGGLARRVEIAKGLLHRPELLLLDEPSVGLDPGARRDLWSHLESLRAKDGVTVLLTTHFLEEADACDRVAILDLGRLAALDTPAALKREIGGEVLHVTTRDPGRVSAWVREQWKLEPTTVDGSLQIAAERAYDRVARLMAEFPDDITEVHVRRPTLEDVFLKKTGHRFWENRIP